MSDRGPSAVEVTLSFLLGTATGFILGVLFAPSSGEDTRKKIHDTAVKSGEKARESYDKIAKEAEKGIKTVREKTHEGIEALKEFVESKKHELSKKHPAPKPAKEEKTK